MAVSFMVQMNALFYKLNTLVVISSDSLSWETFEVNDMVLLDLPRFKHLSFFFFCIIYWWYTFHVLFAKRVLSVKCVDCILLHLKIHCASTEWRPCHVFVSCEVLVEWLFSMPEITRMQKWNPVCNPYKSIPWPYWCHLFLQLARKVKSGHTEV